MQHCDVESDGTLVLGINSPAAVGSVVVHGEGDCVLMFMCVIVYRPPPADLPPPFHLSELSRHIACTKGLDDQNIVCACGNGRSSFAHLVYLS